MKNKAVFFTIMLAMALQTTQGQQETNDRSFIDSLMSEMTVEEKIGQLTLFRTFFER